MTETTLKEKNVLHFNLPLSNTFLDGLPVGGGTDTPGDFHPVVDDGGADQAQTAGPGILFFEHPNSHLDVSNCPGINIKKTNAILKSCLARAELKRKTGFSIFLFFPRTDGPSVTKFARRYGLSCFGS